MSGLVWIIAFARSSDFSGSPPPVLRIDDLDVGVPLPYLVDEPVTAVDAGTARVVMDDDANLAGAADERSQLVGGQRSRGEIVRRGMTALLSRASMHNAEGFFSSAALSRSICSSTMDSFSGPSKVTTTL
jgi:hypothetical protein